MNGLCAFTTRHETLMTNSANCQAHAADATAHVPNADLIRSAATRKTGVAHIRPTGSSTAISITSNTSRAEAYAPHAIASK